MPKQRKSMGRYEDDTLKLDLEKDRLRMYEIIRDLRTEIEMSPRSPSNHEKREIIAQCLQNIGDLDSQLTNIYARQLDLKRAEIMSKKR
jgi:hypothetical protein